VNNFVQTLKNLGTARLVTIFGGGLAMLGFLIYLVARISSPPMEMLFGGLELADSNQIISHLQAEKVPYELRHDGTEVWVPSDRKLDLRVKLAETQLPGGGSVATGYELFDKSDMMGSTSFVQNVNLLRAMEGELARTIKSIDGVKSARVHLVLPKREAFTRETQDPSATIVLKMGGAGRLSRQQVDAIQHLVATAVPKLKPSRISIVDDKGTLLAKSADNDAEALANEADEMKLATEQRLQRTIEELIERSIGGDKVRAEVAVEMDMEHSSTTSETFDPDSKVERSTSTTEEHDEQVDKENSSVSVAQNLPDAGADQAGARSQSKNNHTTETHNYEISKTTKSQIKELGTIKRITASVLVDGRYGPPPEGQKLLTYIPRDQKEMDQLTALVRGAIGFNATRGDQVEVVNMAFAGHDQPEPEEGAGKIFGMDKDLVEKIASNLGLSLVAILFLLLVLRPLVSRAVESLAAQAAAADSRMVGAAGGQALLGAAMPPAPSLGMLPEELESVDELIDIDKVEGRVKASSIRKIGEIVEKHPEEALSIIRNWMYTE
jgi:flagellar M-ring protein FliF